MYWNILLILALVFANGFVVDKFGYIPSQAEKTVLGNHHAAVMDSEPTRIKRILLNKLRNDTDKSGANTDNEKS